MHTSTWSLFALVKVGDKPLFLVEVVYPAVLLHLVPDLLAARDELVVHLVHVDGAVVLHQLLLVALRLLVAQLVLVNRRLEVCSMLHAFDRVLRSGVATCFLSFMKCFLRVPQANHCLLGQHSSCRIGPMTWGTLKKNLTKLSEQVAATHCTYTATGRPNWIIHRELKYFMLSDLPNNVKNTSISGVKSSWTTLYK